MLNLVILFPYTHTLRVNLFHFKFKLSDLIFLCLFIEIKSLHIV